MPDASAKGVAAYVVQPLRQTCRINQTKILACAIERKIFWNYIAPTRRTSSFQDVSVCAQAQTKRKTTHKMREAHFMSGFPFQVRNLNCEQGKNCAKADY